MIASVVAVLEPSYPKAEVLSAIATMPSIEIGDAEAYSYRVPLVIDATSASELEVTTEQLQRCRGVAFVDVVFVHFEEGETNSYAPLAAKGDQP